MVDGKLEVTVEQTKHFPSGPMCRQGADKSMMMRFLPEYFLVAMCSGLMQKRGKGGLGKGPIVKPYLTSLAMVSRSLRADWRFLQVQETDGWVTIPGWKPEKPFIKKMTKSGLGGFFF